MPEERRTQPTAADALALAAALARDEGVATAELAARDHRIGRELASREPVSGTARALAWLDEVRSGDAELRRTHQRMESLQRWTAGLTLSLGLILGWAAALGVFYYDGSDRVNTLAVLAAFVLFPILFLALFVWACLPPSLLAWLPGANAAGSLLRGLSPGRVAGLFIRFLPQRTREAWHQLTGWVEAEGALHGAMRRWTVLRLSQLFALGFQAAALASAFGLVVFTDLAFGWSTTLTSGDPDTDARRLVAITDSMATPWRTLIQDARPSEELIRDSRYFRAASAPLAREQAARLGGWWPFVMMSMLIYGLLPRVVTFAIAHVRTRAATRRTFMATPGLQPVLRRLHQARVETVANEPELARTSKVDAGEKKSHQLDESNEVPIAAINWSAVPVDDARLSAHFSGAPVYHAGGAVSPEQDRSLVVRLAGSPQAAQPIAIVVKAWEPPLMEFIDFVGEIRKSCGRTRAIVVVAVGVGDAEGSPLSAPEPRHLDVWRRKLVSVGDPWLQVCAAEAGEKSQP